MASELALRIVGAIEAAGSYTHPHVLETVDAVLGHGDSPVRVLRLVEYVGPRAWVEETVMRAIHGTRVIGNDKRITAVTITAYPELLVAARQQEVKGVD